MNKIDWAPLDAYSEELMKEYGVPGLSLGISRNGRTLCEKGYGFRDRENSLDATADTVYGIGSCTKSFTALAIMRLEEQGLLSVDDLVTEYLPEFRFGKKDAQSPITIHHLLTHSSGLEVLPSLFFAMLRTMRDDVSVKTLPEGDPIDTYEQLMEFIGGLDIEPLGPPTAHFSYSNDSWALLGAIVERVSKTPYATYVKENILGPLEMTSSFLDFADADSLEITELYATDPDDSKKIIHAPGWWESPSMAAAGFLRSNVPDMLKYLRLFAQDSVEANKVGVSAASLKRMQTAYMHRGHQNYYGYGLGVHANYHGVSLVEHSGGIKGVSAHMMYVPEKDIAVTVLANLSGFPSGQIALAALNLLMGLPLDTRRFEFSDYDCPKYLLAHYEGEYNSPESGVIKVYTEDAKLWVRMGEERMAARPIGVDMFTVSQKRTEDAMRFLHDTRGDCWAVEFGARVLRKI